MGSYSGSSQPQKEVGSNLQEDAAHLYRRINANAGKIQAEVMSAPETRLFLVQNGGEYSSYEVLALFTDKTLAEEYTKAADGVLEEWPANVPREKWMHARGSLWATRTNDNNWNIKIQSYALGPLIAQKEVHITFGHHKAWETPDPDTGKYTHATGNATGQSKEEVEKMMTDAFWKRANELDAT